MDLAAQGVVPLAGGTRLLASAEEVPNLLDLVGLGLSSVRVEDEDLVIGATATLQDLVESPLAYAATAGLLPLACRTASASRTIRGMATLAGEAIHGDPDCEVATALLALNAVFMVAHPKEPRESPALRFLRDPSADLEGGGVVQTVMIPGAPHGAALERAAALPSLPPLVSVAVTTTFSGERLSRVRLAVTGLEGRPARIIEAEAHVERTAGDDEVLREAAECVAREARFREDARASAAHRRQIATVLTLRALRTAVERGRRRETAGDASPPLAGPAPRGRAPAVLHLGTPRAEGQRPQAAGRGRGPHDPPRAAPGRGHLRGQVRLRGGALRRLHGAAGRPTGARPA